MNDTLLRLLATLRLIPRHPRKIAVSELHSLLEGEGYAIDRRSVERDLVKLSSRFQLMSDEAKPQGWSWQPHAPQLDLPALDPQAALTFKLVEQYLRLLLPASTLDFLQPWLRAAGDVLDDSGNGLGKWPDKIRVLPRGQPLLPPSIEPEAQAAIYAALLQHRRVAVSYQPRGAEELKDYVINPLALVVRDHVVYLVCTMWDYADIRHIVLHRVRGARLLDEAATRPADFDLDRHIAQGEFGFPQGEGTLALEASFVRSAAAHLFESPISADQTLTEVEDDNLLLRATVPDTAELRWWLLGFGDQVVVLGPESLREEFRAIAGNLADYYAEQDGDDNRDT